MADSEQSYSHHATVTMYERWLLVVTSSFLAFKTLSSLENANFYVFITLQISLKEPPDALY
jgi:hypothetical protein